MPCRRSFLDPEGLGCLVGSWGLECDLTSCLECRRDSGLRPGGSLGCCNGCVCNSFWGNVARREHRSWQLEGDLLVGLVCDQARGRDHTIKAVGEWGCNSGMLLEQGV